MWEADTGIAGRSVSVHHHIAVVGLRGVLQRWCRRRHCLDDRRADRACARIRVMALEVWEQFFEVRESIGSVA